MGTEAIGRVLTEATIENLKDLWNAEQGLLPPENLDLVVDLRARRLTGNPAHGGEQVFELYWSVEAIHRKADEAFQMLDAMEAEEE
jgi:hypothetical protein